MTAIKLCGFRREADIELAGELGVNAVGFVMWPGSPRAVPVDAVRRLARRLPPLVTPVGVFVEPTLEDLRSAVELAGIRVAQVHGAVGEHVLAGAPCPVIRAVSLRDGAGARPVDALLLLDAHDPARHGGTGTTIDWHAAAAVAATRRVLLAGGLTPDNVTDAIRAARPWGVDVASGIESAPGVKDAVRMRAFVAAVRMAGGPGGPPAGGRT
ncbi:MAG: N-(5'-phosphoribosyl)anthranilate isomerase [Vicinamibacterales bacterium]